MGGQPAVLLLVPVWLFGFRAWGRFFATSECKKDEATERK
jgi:hypothetical protein